MRRFKTSRIHHRYYPTQTAAAVAAAADDDDDEMESVKPESLEKTDRENARKRLQGPYYRQLRIFPAANDKFQIQVVHKNKDSSLISCCMLDLDQQLYNEVLIGHAEETFCTTANFLTAKDMTNCVVTDHEATRREMQTIIRDLVAPRARLHIQLSNFTNVGRLLENLLTLKERVEVFSIAKYSRYLEKTIMTLTNDKFLKTLTVKGFMVENRNLWMHVMRECPEVNLCLDIMQPLDQQELGVMNFVKMCISVASTDVSDKRRKHTLKADINFDSKGLKKFLEANEIEMVQAQLTYGSSKMLTYRRTVKRTLIQVELKQEYLTESICLVRYLTKSGGA